MTIDLNAHAAVLGDPSQFFVESAGRSLPLVVEHTTGAVRYVVTPEGTLSPYEASSLGRLEAGVAVTNPVGFAGFPDHDRSDPAFDLAAHGLDPAAHFVHFEAEHPLVVEHATGSPRHRIVAGRLEPLTADLA